MYGKCTVFESCEKPCDGNILNTNLESTTISSLFTQATAIDTSNTPSHSHGGNDIPAIPSIEEWKEKVLFKAASSQSNSNEQSTFQQKDVPTKRPALGSHSFNYASIECGAKVLSANPEALVFIFTCLSNMKDTSAAVLNEGKDKYMLNECGAKKFLIIELCEEIDVSSIEIGNFEFFSSMVDSLEPMLYCR